MEISEDKIDRIKGATRIVFLSDKISFNDKIKFAKYLDILLNDIYFYLNGNNVIRNRYNILYLFSWWVACGKLRIQYDTGREFFYSIYQKCYWGV